MAEEGNSPQLRIRRSGVRITLREGTTILLVEQNARMALQFAARGYVLESGRLVLEGKSADLLANPQVKQAYLGG